MDAIDLPLFPLHTVLMPSMVLPLHIFEDRYRQMVRTCLREDQRFGVVLIRDGSEVGETASAYGVGTVAEITAAERLEDGRWYLLTEGRQRFRIAERFYDRAYLHGTVELLDEPVGLAENVSPLAAETRSIAARYIRLLLQQAGREDVELDLPGDPVALSYKIGSLLRISEAELQALLELDSAEERLRSEVLILRREYAIFNYMAKLPPAPDKPQLSLN